MWRVAPAEVSCARHRAVATFRPTWLAPGTSVGWCVCGFSRVAVLGGPTEMEVVW
jgi:hypothetical protein